MNDQTEPTRYSTSAVTLHWLLAALLAFQFALGTRLEALPRGAAQFDGFQLHKSVGIAILLLSLARLGIRWALPRPAPVEGSKATMWLAKAVHALLYVVMIGGPITGWIATSTSKIKMQTMLFGTIPWPSLPLGEGWHEPAEGLHGLLAGLFMVLFVLHVAGALRHHFLRHDTIGRMLPPNLASHRAIGWGAAIALLGLGAAFVAARNWTFGGAAAAPIDRVANGTIASGTPSSTPAATASSAASVAPDTTASDAATASAEPSEAAVAAAAWQVAPGGRLGFRASYDGSPVEGSFRSWNADIVFAESDLAHSRIRVTIDLASVDTAEGERDDMLKSDSFFDVATHPRATFTATSIRARGPRRYIASGTLSLHGQSRPITVPFELTVNGNQATAIGTASLNRTAYGVGSNEWAGTDTIADGVSVNFRFSARRQ